VLEKPKLFLNTKEFSLSIVLLLLLIFIRLLFVYQEYQAFKTKLFYYTDVDVLQAYEKFGKKGTYTVLKVHAPSLDINFFTTTNIIVERLPNRLRLKLFPSEKLSFISYLGTGYISSQVNEIYETKTTFKDQLLASIDQQHEDDMIRSFYKAIYFATPLERALREQVSALGVSHLIALSGFHLAILSSILYFLLRPLYRVVQSRYFPYRYDLHDLGMIVLIVLAFYVWFVGAPPSLIRSYAMMFLVWLLLVLGMELISFGFLLTVTLLLIVIFPSLLVSLAFWFSVSGVFYIFLLIKYFSHLNTYLLTLLINFAIFILMLPLIHMVFPLVTSLQLLSPLLSLVFTIFYPISMILHIFNIGGVLDSVLISLFTLEYEKESFRLLGVYGLVYSVLSIMAIYSKKFFYLLATTALLFTIALFTGFLV
jgi:competence protein ComEC